jgi:hypothetical protein
MIDIEVFIITNGRSTFKYCKEAINKQSGVKFNTTIIKNFEWWDAHQKILSECCSKFVLRVDDDMLLHPYALKFMWGCVKDQKKDVALRGWRLWEPWSDKVVKGIKVYNIKAAKKIGFELDKLGKIDKPFARNAERRGYKIRYSQDIVGIHSCGDFKENLRYWEMRGESTGKDFKKKKKWAKDLITNFNMSLEEQYSLTGKFMKKLNKKRDTEFWRFLNEQNSI